jgi:hypothetical protein
MMSGTPKWTPGPWTNCNDSFIEADVSGKVVVEEMNTEIEFMEDEEITANANLIAAAPDLYEALEAILEERYENSELDPLVNDARAALAKARGEAAHTVAPETTPQQKDPTVPNTKDSL